MASLSVWLAHQKSSAKLLQGGRLYPGLSLMLVRAPNAREQMFPVHPAERKPRMVLTSRLQSHWLGHGGLVVSGSIRDKNIFLRTVQWHRGRLKSVHFQNEGQPSEVAIQGPAPWEVTEGRFKQRGRRLCGVRGGNLIFIFFVFTLMHGSPTQVLEPLGTEPCPGPKFKSFFLWVQKVFEAL